MKRNRLANVQSRTLATDPFDATTQSWSTPRTAWFSFEPLRGKEDSEGAQMVAGVTHRGRCEHFTGASSEMRITLSDRTWNVESVFDEHEAGRHLVWLLVEEV